jgi:hypothetical protein
MAAEFPADKIPANKQETFVFHEDFRQLFII